MITDIPLIEGEVIRAVPGHETYYAVTNFGRVFSLNYRRTGVPHELAQSALTDKRRASKSKYQRVKAYAVNKHTPTTVHFLVALAFIPNPEGHRQVNHIDGDKGNNWAVNLEWCSVRQNSQHAEATGLSIHPKGQDHPGAILSESQAIEIKRLVRRGDATLKEIGGLYGVSKHAVYDIKRSRSWRHLP